METEVTSNRGRGRPSYYDPDFVRDISVQVLVEFYNGRPEVLRKQIEKDADYVSKLRDKAKYMDVTALQWLTALDWTPKEHPNYRPELMFRAWCLALDQPRNQSWSDRFPAEWQALREAMLKHMTDWHWRMNCQRWIDAIKRVRLDKCMTIRVPAVFEDDGDDFL